MRHLLLLLIVSCCGGQVTAESLPIPEYGLGWCCGGMCGYSGHYADRYNGTCYCPEGIVRYSVDSLSGDCIAQTDAQKASRK